MQKFEHASSSFSRLEFDRWLAQRRAEEGLTPAIPRSGRPIFKSWLRDVWPSLRELPETKGLGLFCERDVTMLVAEFAETALIAGHPCALKVFEVLPINRPKRADILGMRLGQLSADAAPQLPEIQNEIH